MHASREERVAAATTVMNSIQQAREFLRSQVQQPALGDPDLPAKIKAKVKNSDIWLERFERVGDLLIYLKRFQVDPTDEVYQAMKARHLLTFEDVLPAFEAKFKAWAHDFTRPSDFVVGQPYTAHQILIFARNYDTRAGGMFVVGDNEQPPAVVIKATLAGGRYPNEWIEPNKRLKYYLKSIGNKFSEDFKANATIINERHIPILTFTRPFDTGPFTYQGTFRYHDIHREQDGAKWFELWRSIPEQGMPVYANFVAEELGTAVAQSMKDSREQRLMRLAQAPKKPLSMMTVSVGYQRNADVVAEVLHRANGSCEGCGKLAPFNRRSDGSPYLEVHHKLPLAKGGDDTVANAIALCPNCHRQAHFG